MRISIITVAFNSEKTIERTMASVSNQNFKDYEYIIIDGKSEDNTLAICKKHAKENFKIISEKDSGIYDAMNKGVDMASGELIVILNSDDYLATPECLNLIDQNFPKSIDALLGNVEIFSETSKKITRIYRSSLYFPFLCKFGVQPPHPAAVIRKDVYQNFGKFNTKYRIAADFDFLTRILRIHKIKYRKLNTTLVFMSDGGISNSGLATRNRTTYEILDSLKNNGIYSNFILASLRFAIKIPQLLKI